MRLLVWQPVYVLGGGLNVLRSLVAGLGRRLGVDRITLALNSRYQLDDVLPDHGRAGLRVVRIDADTPLAWHVAGHDAVYVPWPHGAPFEPCDIPAVCIVHDTVLLDAIGAHATREFLEAVEKGVRDAAADYDHTILTSHYTLRRMIEITGGDCAHRFTVIPHMADEPVAKACGSLPSTVQSPFFVYPANAAEHKNHATLFRALVRRRRNVPVVIYGYGTEQIGSTAFSDRPHINQINRIIHDRGLIAGRDFVNLGYVNDRTARVVFDSAIGLVMPTRAEGMGLPIHEAIAAGKPVICSDIEVLREHYEHRSEAILWVDPDCPCELAAALDRVYDEEEFLRERAAGNRGCGRTWDWIADETIRILAGLVAEHQRGALPARPRRPARGRSRGLHTLLRKLRGRA